MTRTSALQSRRRRRRRGSPRRPPAGALPSGPISAARDSDGAASQSALGCCVRRRRGPRGGDRVSRWSPSDPRRSPSTTLDAPRDRHRVLGFDVDLPSGLDKSPQQTDVREDPRRNHRRGVDEDPTLVQRPRRAAAGHTRMMQTGGASGASTNGGRGPSRRDGVVARGRRHRTRADLRILPMTSTCHRRVRPYRWRATNALEWMASRQPSEKQESPRREHPPDGSPAIAALVRDEAAGESTRHSLRTTRSKRSIPENGRNVPSGGGTRAQPPRRSSPTSSPRRTCRGALAEREHSSATRRIPWKTLIRRHLRDGTLSSSRTAGCSAGPATRELHIAEGICRGPYASRPRMR